MPAVFPIRVTKSPFQPGLLDEWKVNQIEDPETGGPDSMRPGPEPERFAKQDQDNARNHGITDVLIRSTDHKHPGRIPRGEGTPALDGKPPYGSDKKYQAHAEQRKANPLKEEDADRTTQGEHHAVLPGEPNRTEHRHGKRKEQDREQMTKQFNHLRQRLMVFRTFLSVNNGFATHSQSAVPSGWRCMTHEVPGTGCRANFQVPSRPDGGFTIALSFAHS